MLSEASLDAKVGPEDGGHFPILGMRSDSWQGRGGHLKRELRTTDSGGIHKLDFPWSVPFIHSVGISLSTRWTHR